VTRYVEKAMDGDAGAFAVMRVLRLARVTRIFKLAKYSAWMQVGTRQACPPAVA
jgi:hypothetical protein